MSLITWWPNGGGAVTFASVKAALQVASSAVSFNLQELQSVGAINGLDIRAGVGERSIVLGDSLTGLPAGINRFAFGKAALAIAGATTDDTIAIGNDSQALNTAGDRCISLGHRAFAALTTGDDNIAVGTDASSTLTTGARTVAIGTSALAANTSASGSVAVGYHAGLLNNGADNVFVGDRAAAAATAASNTVALGRFALSGVTTGIQNVAVGQSAGPSITTQNNNTFVGNNAGANAASAGNICLGASADTPDAANPNGLSIGNAIMGDLTLTGAGPKVRIGGSGSVAALTELLALVQLGNDTVPVLTLQTTGTNGAKTSLYVGSRDPSGAVSALGGSYYQRVSGATSGLYVNRTAGTGTSWSLVTAVP
ncbi:MAG: hypothetical protein ACOYD1_12770 [Candidatus Nanopelagicales bacterium]